MAVTVDRAGLLEAVNGLKSADDAVVDRLLSVVTALVLKEAGTDTPEAILNEAAIRAVGWLYQSGVSLGQLFDLDHRSHGVSCMRASGARAILSSWKDRTL